MARRGGKYARGRKARAICQRGGHEIPYRYLVREPGTGFYVDRRWSDGRWNEVDHPANHPPMHYDDERPLRYPTGGTEFPASTITGTLAEVSLPGGGGLIVTEELASITCVPLQNEDCQAIMVSASTTLDTCVSFLFYRDYAKIE